MKGKIKATILNSICSKLFRPFINKCYNRIIGSKGVIYRRNIYIDNTDNISIDSGTFLNGRL